MTETRKKGEHLANKKIKTGIIEFLLSQKEEVSEPDIRKRLSKKDFNVIDQGTINKHLHSLLDKEFGCIELIPPDKKGLPNHWNVINIKTLRNIRHKFPEIQLNKYEKSISIVLKESGYNVDRVKGLEFYIRLCLSASFFNTCLETDINTLQKRAWKVYLRDRGFETNKHIKKILNEFYYEFVKNSPKITMSEEAFKEVVKEIEQKGSMDFEYTFFGSKGDPVSEFFRKKFTGLEIMMSRDIFMEIEREVLQRVDESPTRKRKFNETYDEEDIRLHETFFEKRCEELYKKGNDWGKLSLEEFKKIINGDRKLHMKIDEISSLIEKQREAFKELGFGLQLHHFLNHDILIGAEPDEEFEEKVKEIESNLHSELDKSVGFSYTGDCMYDLLVLRIAIEFILKYKQPKIFCVSDDKVAIFKYLLKFYAHPLNLSGLFIEEIGDLKSILKLYGLKEQES